MKGLHIGGIVMVALVALGAVWAVNRFSEKGIASFGKK